ARIYLTNDDAELRRPAAMIDRGEVGEANRTEICVRLALTFIDREMDRLRRGDDPRVQLRPLLDRDKVGARECARRAEIVLPARTQRDEITPHRPQRHLLPDDVQHPRTLVHAVPLLTNHENRRDAESAKDAKEEKNKNSLRSSRPFGRPLGSIC